VIIKTIIFIYTLLLEKKGNQWPSLTAVIEKTAKVWYETYNR